ncbi:MAG: hypothetical protein ACYC26_01435 [Phycisphaerales bacterium]
MSNVRCSMCDVLRSHPAMRCAAYIAHCTLHIAHRAGLAAVLMTAAFALAGCDTVGYVATAIGGGGDIPALYALKDRPTLVFVDDPAHKLSTTTLAGLIAGRVGQELEDQKVVTRVIDPTVVDQMRAEHSEFATWPIDKIGKQAGAEQVIYISVQEWRMVTEGGAMYEPTCEVRVKVVDVPSGTRLFPDPSTELGYPMVTQRRHTDMLQADAATGLVLARDLAEHAAGDTAKMFYAHPGPEPGAKK